MIHCESNLDTMARMPDNHVSAIVTDPPYGLKFMGKKWDADVPSVATFAEMLRIAKPGAMLLCFAGTRTYHRMAVNIEDAGWIVRDMMTWIYGSGFPKSLDVSKAIDELHGAEPLQTRIPNPGKPRNPNPKYGMGASGNNNTQLREIPEFLTAPATEDAKLWNGYKSALKPAMEPICVAMKPLDGTFAENALKWGVAGFWVDGGRIAHNEKIRILKKQETGHDFYKQAGRYKDTPELKEAGRYPANVILDEEAAAVLDEQSGVLKSGENKPLASAKENGACYGKFNAANINYFPASEGGASRFFYVAKASPAERNAGLEGMEKVRVNKMNSFGDQNEFDCPDGAHRNGDKGSAAMENFHPTVKPLSLMRHLVRLTRPPTGGTLYDPFMGSGTTGIACVLEDVDFIGSELETEYAEIAERRIAWAVKQREIETAQQELF